VPPARPAAPADVSHGYPFVPSDRSSYVGQHHDYPAADIFAACGTPVRSVVDGTVVEMSRANRYDARVDDPATRGGIFVAVRGDDGVRYYMAHLRALAGSIAVGRRVARGDPVGEVGETGRASTCHLHFSISPPCTTGEWWVRRGAVWPQPYLDSWRAGGNLSPVSQVRQFLADNPHACSSPGSMPWPST
jgi:murein DD-endopeptidase MepM/ murein hydrolase activator NlpD